MDELVRIHEQSCKCVDAGVNHLNPVHAPPPLCQQMRDASASALLVTTLDEVAWLLNLRGSDVQCNPVFLAYCVVPLEGPASVYVDISKVPADVAEALKVR